MRKTLTIITVRFTVIYLAILVGFGAVLYLLDSQFNGGSEGILSPVAMIFASMLAGGGFYRRLDRRPTGNEAWVFAAWFTFAAFIAVLIVTTLALPFATIMGPFSPALLISLILEGRIYPALIMIYLAIMLLHYIAARVFFAIGANRRATA